ncbi:hypothetical protein [Galbitalea soli]|uniref:Uncharacterized protein n=1 Tax=Galbitalea soli TaxID=1268042 RepID=A0A7C9PMS3_9MICO|nr:hypothetical protein [Galbitalea soli]NEM91193.1 hypothetical protein [Galbitalea soli]NYJ29882.1 hypothetical protein [Galbitalea soli]
MPSIRFRLDHPTLPALRARVAAEFGPDARIVSATEVRLGGIGGFFARRFVDVEVELVAPPVAPVAPAPARPKLTGIDALLAAADRVERAEDRGPLLAVSTETEPFTRLLDDLKSYVEGPAAPPPAVLVPSAPLAPSAEPGSLVALVGLGDDAVVVARSLALSLDNAEVSFGGSISIARGARVDDRRSAAAARARGVEAGSAGILAYGIGPGGPASVSSIEALRSIMADQVWVVVDASRKAEDTAAWVAAVRKQVSVQAMAVVHSAFSATADSVHGLGLRSGWSDAVG